MQTENNIPEIEPDEPTYIDDEMAAEFYDEDPIYNEEVRYHEDFHDFVGQDGTLHAKVF